MLWPILLQVVEIDFAHTSFKWSNSAKGNAGVTCIIVGLRNPSQNEKYIFSNSVRQSATNINPYLADGKNIIIHKLSKPLSSVLPPMSYGSKPVDGGNLILTTEEKEKLLIEYPQAAVYLKRLIGADEFIKGTERWCLWITDKDLDLAMNIPEIKKRIDKVRVFRQSSKKIATKKSASVSHKFGEIRFKSSESVIIPSVTSEDRQYIPMDYLSKDVVVTNRAHVILDCPAYVFGIITSRMHMVWVKSVAGRLESRISYSTTICYNNFPVPTLNKKQTEMITRSALEIIDAREKHPEKSIAEMYKTEIMPTDLKQAHDDLDQIVASCYRARPLDAAEDRLAYLFKLYEIMTKTQKELI